MVPHLHTRDSRTTSRATGFSLNTDGVVWGLRRTAAHAARLSGLRSAGMVLDTRYTVHRRQGA